MVGRAPLFWLVVWLIAGTIVMTAVVSSVVLAWPLGQGESDGIVVAVLAGRFAGAVIIGILVILDVRRLIERRDLDRLQRCANG